MNYAGQYIAHSFKKKHNYGIHINGKGSYGSNRQQSAAAFAYGLKFLQLLVPTTRDPEHSESESQSPWPIEQTLFVQNDQSVTVALAERTYVLPAI